MKNANPVSAWLGAVAACLALAAAGCGSGKEPQAAASTKTVWDRFAFDLGGHPVNLQVAVLPDEQARGLMQRPDLGKDDGMIFIGSDPRRQSFWMRNTPEALDVAYLTPDGAIAEIYPLLPFDERSVDSHSDRIKFAVEMPQGWFAAHGVRPGARVDLKAVADALKARGYEAERFGIR